MICDYSVVPAHSPAHQKPQSRQMLYWGEMLPEECVHVRELVEWRGDREPSQTLIHLGPNDRLLRIEDPAEAIIVASRRQPSA